MGPPKHCLAQDILLGLDTGALTLSVLVCQLEVLAGTAFCFMMTVDLAWRERTCCVCQTMVLLPHRYLRVIWEAMLLAGACTCAGKLCGA